MSRFTIVFQLLAILVLALVIGWAVFHVRSDTTDIKQWLPDTQQERKDYDLFVKNFGQDDYLVVSWEGCVIQDPRIAEFCDLIEKSHGEEALDKDQAWIAHVYSGPKSLERLMAPPLSLDREEALARLAGFLVSERDDTSAIFLQLNALGKTHHLELVRNVEELALRNLELNQSQLKLGGSAYEVVMIDRESINAIKKYVIPSSILVLVISWIFLRNVGYTISVLVVAVLSQAFSVALLYYTDSSLNAVLVVMPTLVYVVTISSAIHYVNYYQDAINHGHPTPAQRAFQHGWLPCTMAATTTAAGLLSLGTSELQPVRYFGVYSAISVMFSLAAVLFLLPALIQLWPNKPTARNASSMQHANTIGAMWANFTIRYSKRINVAFMLLMAVGAGGIPQLKTSVNLQRMFPEESELIRNYQWLEKNVGPLISIEVLVHFDNESTLNLVSKVDLINEIQAELEQLPQVGAVMSATNFCPEIPSAESANAVKRRVLSKQMERNRDQLIAEGFLANTPTDEQWRITARVSALQGLDYDAFVHDVRNAVRPVIEKQDPELAKHIRTSFTGLTPLVYQAQKQLLADLITSFLSAVLLICPIMMYCTGGVWRGLMSMIPNIAPVLIVFGAIGYFQIPVDIGVVLTASVALGLAVDGTLHFINWYLHDLNRGESTGDSLRGAIVNCGGAMLQSTAICSIGILVFAFSSFIPASRFAWLLTVLMIVALIADLVQLPALLCSQIGRVLFKKTSSPGIETVEQATSM